MGLKKFIDDHPLKILASVVVVVATTASGFTGYLFNEKNQIEKSRLELDWKSEAAGLKTEIASFKARLASIERRVETDERSFFDVSKLILTPDQVRGLDRSSFKSMADGAFFIAEPPMARWRHARLSEYEMFQDAFEFEKGAKTLAPFAQGTGKKDVEIWKSDEVFVSHPALKEGMEDLGIKSWVIRPNVAVQVMTERDFQAATHAAAQLMKKSTRTEDLVNELDETKRGAVKESVKTDGASGPPKVETAEQKAAAAEATAKSEKALSELFRGDFAAFLLRTLVVGNMDVVDLFANVRFSLRTVQKKGNVLHMETRMEFDDVMVDGRPNPGRLVVDQEYFVFTNPSAVVVVKVQVPSFDGTAEAYSWVTQWLTGLRVPLVR